MGDAVGRLGGDEVGILLPRTDREQAEQVLARIHEKVSAAFVPFQSTSATISASVGAVVYDGQRHLNIEELLAKADTQMYTVDSDQGGQQNRGGLEGSPEALTGVGLDSLRNVESRMGERWMVGTCRFLAVPLR